MHCEQLVKVQNAKLHQIVRYIIYIAMPIKVQRHLFTIQMNVDIEHIWFEAIFCYLYTIIKVQISQVRYISTDKWIKTVRVYLNTKVLLLKLYVYYTLYNQRKYEGMLKNAEIHFDFLFLETELPLCKDEQLQALIKHA